MQENDKKFNASEQLKFTSSLLGASKVRLEIMLEAAEEIEKWLQDPNACLSDYPKYPKLIEIDLKRMFLMLRKETIEAEANIIELSDRFSSKLFHMQEEVRKQQREESEDGKQCDSL